jgi:hypothetical protein
MEITKVISFRGAWNRLKQENYNELEEIKTLLSQFIEEYNIEKSMPVDRESNSNYFLNVPKIWSKVCLNHRWQTLGRKTRSGYGQVVDFREVGPVKNKVSITLPFYNLQHVNKWLFQLTSVVVRNGIVKIPIMLLPVDEMHRLAPFKVKYEVYEKQLLAVNPLTQGYPFLILGFKENGDALEPDVIELDVDDFKLNNVTIERSIEFPPEFYQAGINILSFFGTYIRDQYPSENAKVKIEQDGNMVRLVVETTDGKTEVVEKALEEYQLIVSGKEPAEKFTTNEKLILELKQEVRLFKVRVESQMDIIQLQAGQIEKLFKMVGEGLTNKAPLVIDFKPVITASSVINFNQNISSALGTIAELKDLLPKESSAFRDIEDLEISLEKLEKETDPNIVRRSPALSKFRRIIDTITEGNTELEKAIKAVTNGWGIFKDLAGKYNKIAEWCGLPQVPKVFTS